MDTSPPTKRNHWLAALFSFLAVGLGHLYVGRPWRGLLFLLLFLGFGIGVPWLGLPASIYGFAFWFIGLYVVYFYQIADAERIARRTVDYSPRRYNQWYWYVTALLVLAVIESSVVRYKDDYSNYNTFRIPAGSMEPALKAGDFIVSQRLGAGDKIQRGDIVIFHYPANPKVSYVKRVVAVAGDRLALDNGRLILNGAVVAEPYVLPANALKPDSQTFGPERVPDGNVFVLGDKRDFSNDSRYWGPLPVALIYARPLYVWINYQPNVGMDWGKIGRVVN